MKKESNPPPPEGVKKPPPPSNASEQEAIVMCGSDLYMRQIAESEDELMHMVWDGTPWMIEAFTGRTGDEDRDCKIRKWCVDNFGKEAWPIHGGVGVWHRGGATVMGWTWMGFKTEEMMNKFIEAWPAPDGV